MFAKPGAPQREEMSTIRVKNTMLLLNGQNLRLAAKNGRVSKTPGRHLSAKHGKEAVGQLTASPVTQEGTAQLELKPTRPDLEREAENQPVRRPLKLAPLELPEEVKEAQRQKLKFGQQEAKPASCKLDVTLNATRKVKSSVRQRPIKAAPSPSASTQTLKAQQQNRSLRPQPTHPSPAEQNGDRHLEDVVCRGTPAPLCSKPAPPLLSPRGKAQASRGGETTRPSLSSLQQETAGRRRLRLRRVQCLEEDQCNTNMSTGGLSAVEDKLAQGVRGTGQQLAGKGIKEPPAASLERGSIRKSHQDVCCQQAGGSTLNRQSAEGGSSGHAPDSVRPNASNWKSKRKKALIAKHKNTVAVEQLQL
ncbi:uncharacterized protein LOC118124972 [Hippoglossus stenolepis]|uniref:uncharacterized protein LOC118124972 n=1 Tax=Hippoglossus stenolepis TaxID=195615 RepID=UPI00159C8875|nr:uncharacterized protein LOC118124972 [Hippoglossus stenolepis]